MLQYLYTYEIFNHGLTAETSYQLLILGDKYELEEIRDAGFQILSNKKANLTPHNGQWAADWYPRICQLQQKRTESLKTQLANAIVGHAGEMIKNEGVRELIASDGQLAVLLVEKLAEKLAKPVTHTSIFGTPKDATAREATNPIFGATPWHQKKCHEP